MLRHVLAAVLVLLLGPLAGCMDGSDGMADATDGPGGPRTGPGEDAGVIRGTVTNDELVPLEGAVVSIDALAVAEVTGADGVFEVRDVPPGTHRLVIQALGHQSIAAQVTVVAGEVQEGQYTLAPLAVIEPFTEVFILAGYTECVASLIWFTYYVSLPLCTEQKHVLELAVSGSWRYGVLELEWEGESSMHFISDTDTNCGFGNESTNSCFYWKIGRSPLRLDAKPMDPAYVQWRMLYPEAFQWVLTGLDAGLLQEEINDAPLCDLGYQTVAGYSADCGGVGAGYPGYRFDLYASVFHHEIPPDPSTYSAVPEA